MNGKKEIPIDDARELMKLHVNNIVNKIRYIVPNEKLNFEVDKFFNKKFVPEQLIQHINCKDLKL